MATSLLLPKNCKLIYNQIAAFLICKSGSLEVLRTFQPTYCGKYLTLQWRKPGRPMPSRPPIQLPRPGFGQDSPSLLPNAEPAEDMRSPQLEWRSP